ncbi:MAG: ketoacyl-ACP synthase III [Proteobacteria bacterium]|jgi:3-oxoacyl-[acyl-carrier-protein] synthase III|nr:ketoacyl-ACP synthase III [Pseudomonadota bacterium]
MQTEFKKIKISSWGGYLPSRKLTNEDMSKIVETNDEWIVQRTGITQRFFAKEDEFTSDLAMQSALVSLKGRTHIDGIVVATTTPDLIFPSTACIVQRKLKERGITSNFAFDIQAVCAGFVYAVTNAYCHINSGLAKSILVIGADTLSRILDFTDRTTCVLFGDGAGSCIVEENTQDTKSGIITASLHSDGSYTDILKTTGGVSQKGTGFLTMQGQDVFKHAVSKMQASIEELMEKANITKDDISFIVPHQANARILDAIAKRMEIPDEKFIKTIQKHANTSSATIPLAMWEENSKFKEGDLMIMEALGGGLTWGGVVFRY